MQTIKTIGLDLIAREFTRLAIVGSVPDGQPQQRLHIYAGAHLNADPAT